MDILREYFKESKCRAFDSGFSITYKDKQNIKHEVEPDILVLCNIKDYSNINDKELIPTIIFEITSLSNSHYDYIKKLDIYRRMGVFEYYIVNPISYKVTYYKFKNNEIEDTDVYLKGRNKDIESQVYENLIINLEEIF